ncbi:ferredoxin [Loigolactobacillus iwatensis]|uniref:ferredoxin n=1 Tax=Loigolactobacillus iwatensis TaxID=1267156 RepID=UPI000F7F2E0A|nr:ferredoxin [Loigolactobacillus iwatensis]
MYSKVQQEQCIACGLCQINAPQLFDYQTNGIAYFKPDNNLGKTPIAADQLANFKKAYQNCPTHAIIRQNIPFNIKRT